MSAFGGFKVVGDELRRESRLETYNFVIRPQMIERMATRDYLIGVDAATGRQVRAVLSDYRVYDGRPSLQDRVDELGDAGGVILLTGCKMNRNGTIEASSAQAFSASTPIVTDGLMRVCAPIQRDDGSWSQSIQHVRNEFARACGDYMSIVDGIYSALSEPGLGRSGAIVRGWHPGQDGVMGFEVGLVFDHDELSYLDADASFAAFLAAPDIWVGGLGVKASGERCMEIVGDLIDKHPKDIVWEVIPKRTYSLGGFIAEAAGTRTGKDVSAPYRIGDTIRTGCLPSIIAFVERNGVFWPRVAVPQTTKKPPIPEIRVSTAFVSPANDILSDRVHSHEKPVDKRKSQVDAVVTLPMPSDLVLPRVAAAGYDAPDLGSPDGSGAIDEAALSAAEHEQDMVPTAMMRT